MRLIERYGGNYRVGDVEVRSEEDFYDLPEEKQALLLTYEQIRELEEQDELCIVAGVSLEKKSAGAGRKRR